MFSFPAGETCFQDPWPKSIEKDGLTEFLREAIFFHQDEKNSMGLGRGKANRKKESNGEGKGEGKRVDKSKNLWKV